MAICVQIFRGQGIFTKDRGYGTVHGFVSPTEIRIRFREGFEVVPIDEVLPVVALESVAQRFEERQIEIELDPITRRNNELEPEVFEKEGEMAEEMA
jgi:hypothetical protein